MNEDDMDIMRAITHVEDAIKELQTMDTDHPQVKLAMEELKNSRQWMLKFLNGRGNQKIRHQDLKKEEAIPFAFEIDPEIEDCLQRWADRLRQDSTDLDLNNRPYSIKLMNTFVELINIGNRLIDCIDGYDTGVPGPY